MSQKTQKFLRPLIQEALYRRKDLSRQFKNFRLFHGLVDGQDDLYIDNLSGTFLIQTLSPTTDVYGDDLVLILQDFFELQAILLKNFTKARQTKNLELSDQILFGALPQNVIEIQENEATYSYDLNEKEVYPLIDRDFRQKINESLKNHESVLVIDATALKNIPQDKQNSCEIILSNNFTTICGELRGKEQTEKRFDAAFINLQGLRKKNFDTSLFHLFYHMLSVLKKTAGLFVTTQNSLAVKSTLHKVAKKTGKNVTLTRSLSQPEDFPVALAQKFLREILVFRKL